MIEEQSPPLMLNPRNCGFLGIIESAGEGARAFDLFEGQKFFRPPSSATLKAKMPADILSGHLRLLSAKSA